MLQLLQVNYRTKLNLSIIVLLFLFIGCKKKSTETELTENIDQTSGSLVAIGNFSSNAHSTSGKASVYSKSTVKSLVFEGFKTDSGPDLRVYLATELNTKSFTEIGKLKATSGNFSYDFSTTINTDDYKYVLIWCEDFSVLFGSALLK
jgi:hypothetical protein